MAETDRKSEGSPDPETLAQWARDAAAELPGIPELAARWIDTSTFLDADALPKEDEAGG